MLSVMVAVWYDGCLGAVVLQGVGGPPKHIQFVFHMFLEHTRMWQWSVKPASALPTELRAVLLLLWCCRAVLLLL